jgi:peptidoglycan/LPS O-acetylase OafA/YrhL
VNRSLIRRFHGLDTLRAAAILLVMVFHSTDRVPDWLVPLARFGWMGVDLFFVLSGYLIGTQLLRPYAEGSRPSWWDFYRRRIYRVVPVYLVVLGLYLFVPMWREAPGLSPAWEFLTFTENLFVDYGKNQAFSHVWSLCVEEHFYLILPVLVALLMRRPKIWKGVAAIVALVGLGIVLRGWILHSVLRTLEPGTGRYSLAYIEKIYYPTWTRLDGLIAGVALAAVRQFRPAWWTGMMRRGHAATVGGMLLTGVSGWMFRDRMSSDTGVAAWGIVVGFPLLSMGLGLLLVSSVSEDGVLARVRVPGAETIALLSYGLYLTHKEVMHLTALAAPELNDQYPGMFFVAGTAGCFAVAVLLHLGIERPCLALRNSRGKGRRLEREVLRDPPL